MIHLNVTAVDPDGQPIAGAIVTLFTFDAAGKPCPVEPAIRNWGNFYASEGAYAPAGTHPPFTVYGQATAPGYGVSYIPMTPWDGKSSLDLSVTLALFKRPFTPAPRVYTGNLCGLRIPGLPPVAGGADDPALFLSWFYDRYPKAVRDGLCRPALKAKRALDVLLSWPDARVAGASPTAFRDICRELVADGLRPCVMLSSKDVDPWHNVPAILANIAPVLPLLVGLVPRFCVGWELSIWLYPFEVQQLIDALAPQWLKQPGTLGYVHFEQRYMSDPEAGHDNASFWRKQVGKLTGVFAQKLLSQTDAEYLDWIHDCLERMAGDDNMPLDSGFGHPFDFVMFEISAALQFNGSCSEAEGDRLGRLALHAPSVTGPAGTVSVMGSGNGE